jgi:drug/metabolite transporter (DMT)-like permease
VTSLKSHRGRVVLALLAVYVIWGSTYLAILEAIRTIPPLWMASIRMMLAAVPMLLWSRWRTGVWPSRRAWPIAAISGVLMFTCGNGAVTWSEQSVPTGLAALIVASVSIWTVLIDTVVMSRLRPGGARSSAVVWLGVVIGFSGLLVLVDPFSPRHPAAASGVHVPLFGATVLVVGSLAWAIGSVLSIEAVQQKISQGVELAALQMLCGGIGLFPAGLLRGEHYEFDLGSISWLSIGCVLYLVIAGSMIAFTAYNWLLVHTSPAVATTYAYVNPLVAIALGALLADERLTLRIVIASLMILGAVALILRARTRASVASKGAEDSLATGPLAVEVAEQQRHVGQLEPNDRIVR